MRDEVIRAALSDPDNYYDPEDGVLYGPGNVGYGDRVELARFSPELMARYGGPLPAWVARRGLKLWDVVANQYDPTEPAMVVTPDGIRSVDSEGVWRWDEIRSDFGEDLEDFFDGLVRFNRD